MSTLLFSFDSPSRIDIIAVHKCAGYSHTQLAALSGASLPDWDAYYNGQKQMPYANWLALNAQLYMLQTGVNVYWNTPREVFDPKPKVVKSEVFVPPWMDTANGQQAVQRTIAAVEECASRTTFENRLEGPILTSYRELFGERGIPHDKYYAVVAYLKTFYKEPT